MAFLRTRTAAGVIGGIVAIAVLAGVTYDFADSRKDLRTHAAAATGGADLTASAGHAEYTAPGSTSQHNLGATVAGLPGNRVLTEDNSDVGDEVRGGIPFL